MNRRAASSLAAVLLLAGSAVSAQPLRVRTSASSPVMARPVEEARTLRLDDGSMESAISTPDNGPFVWLNVFTPPANLTPFRVREVSVLWTDYVRIGQTADIYLDVDRDGDHDPSTGAVLIGKQEGVRVQFNDETTFSTYSLAQSPLVQQGEDLIVAVVNSGITGRNEDPAAFDEDAPPGRAWVGL